MNTIDFIEQNLKLNHQVNGLIPFKLYDHQRQMIESFDEQSTLAITCRQSGKTIVLCAYALYNFLCKENQTIFITGPNRTMSRILFEYLKLMLDQLPEFNVEFKKNSIELGNGNRIITNAINKNALAGFEPTLIILDEFAYAEFVNGFWQSCISSGAKIIIATTNNPIKTFVTDIWNNWDHNKIRIPVDMIPWYSEEFKQNTIVQMGAD